MSVLMRPWGHQHFRVRGNAGGQSTNLPVLFLNSLGTDVRMWDGVIDRLPHLHAIGMDKRGHGLSATPVADWTLDDLVHDALAVLDHRGIGRAVLAGCSIGGMIAQRAAVLAPQRVAGVFLSNTAMKVGSAESWQARIDGVTAIGLHAMAPQIMARWFGPAFCASADAMAWQTLLSHGDDAGYIATCKVLAGTDLSQSSPLIACPVLMLAGTADQSTPPDLIHATAAAIPGAQVQVIDGAGHIPAIDSPDQTAHLLDQFCRGLA
jgi:3-oxoadipate enol-lactonase